jgi:hypothetical protein
MAKLNYSEYLGKRFNDLLVIDTIKRMDYKQPRMQAVCKCECGKITYQDFYDLRLNHVKTCGCGKIYEDANFRYMLNNTKNSSKNVDRKCNNLTIEDLKEKWEQQNGMCAYTGIELVLPINSCKPNPDVSYKMASIDRIDSSKPYTKDNIQFVKGQAHYVLA